MEDLQKHPSEEQPQTEPKPEQPIVVHAQKSNKKLLIAVAIILVIAALGAIAWLVSNNKTEPANNSATQTTEEEPSKRSIKISVAEEGTLVLPNGYADPTIAKTTNGYRMYVNRQSGGPSGYYTFTSSDGKTWTKEKDMVIPGVSTGRAIVLPEGVRVYFPGPQPIKPSDAPADIFSSFSTDGLMFTKESGSRVKPRSNQHYLEGPTVFQLADKSWRMYFNENTIASGNQRDGEIWGASSPDGLTWSRDQEVTLQSDQVEDTLNQPWKQVLHPFVIANPKGGYLMFYNAHSEVFAASSDDGKAWTKIGKVGVHGADVDGYFQEDGTLRIFYGDFSPQTGGVVYTAVLNVE